MTIDYRTQAENHVEEVTALRHRLHAHPELGDHLPRTQQAVLGALAGLDLEITTGTAATSVTAVLRGRGGDPDARRPVVLLRGDMDGLPVQEEAAVPYRSQREGHMHGCGHDVHTATLVGAAHLLHARRNDLPGDVVFMFQPGEETLTGARIMIEEGILEAAGRPVDRAYALHVLSSLLPSGQWATRPGPVAAASDALILDIVGTGGHASAPHRANDPVPVMAEVITGVQTLIAKKFSAEDPVIINVGVARAGNARNVIPESCHLEMSIRSFSPQARERVRTQLIALVEGICAAHGVRASYDYELGVAPTVNDDRSVEAAERVLGRIVGDRYVPMAQALGGSEDFSEVLARVPGAFLIYSGVPAGRDLADTTYNHSATAEFDDAVLPEAMAVYAALAHDSLEELVG